MGAAMASRRYVALCLLCALPGARSALSNASRADLPTMQPGFLDFSQSPDDQTERSVFQNEMPTRPPSFLERSELSDEKHLIHDLLEKYERLGRDGRPVKNVSHPVKVEFGLGLIKMELHEKENVLALSTWARYRWKDDYLIWNPDDYGGVVSVKMSYEKIWIPDVMLYNTANTDESQRKVMAVVMFDGTVTWYPHKVFRSSCAIDVRNFPFDNQTCFMWFGSWTHTLAEMDVNLAFPGGIDLSTFKTVYKDVSEWDIFNHTADRSVMPEGAGGDGYAILSFKLELKRKMMFSTYILTMPAVFLAFLTLLVFWLPPEHADKSALGLTIFGSLLLLLLILVEAAPPTASAVPLLGLYYCFTTVIVILSIFLSSVVVKIGKSSENRRAMPKWLRVVMLEGVGRAVCLRYSTSCNQPFFRAGGDGGGGSRRRGGSPGRGDSRHGRRGDFPVLEESQCRELLSRLSSQKDEKTTEFIEDFRQNGTGPPNALLTIDRRLRYMHELVNTLVSRRTERESIDLRDREIERQWRHLALVLDRIFFCMYLVIIIISLVIFFPREQRAT